MQTVRRGEGRLGWAAERVALLVLVLGLVSVIQSTAPAAAEAVGELGQVMSVGVRCVGQPSWVC